MGNTSSASKNKYNAKAYDRIVVVVKKGEKERIKKYCEKHGYSVNGLITELIRHELAGFNPDED